MWNLLNNDIYDRFDREHVASVVHLSEHFNRELTGTDSIDKELETQIVQAVQFAISRLSDYEYQLLFFRYIQGHSFRTLTKTFRSCNKLTMLRHVRKLRLKIIAYTMYYLESDYDRDIYCIMDALGHRAAMTAEKLFSGWSAYRIYRGSAYGRGMKSLNRTILDVQNLCREVPYLFAFLDVIDNVK